MTNTLQMHLAANQMTVSLCSTWNQYALGSNLLPAEFKSSMIRIQRHLVFVRHLFGYTSKIGEIEPESAEAVSSFVL